MDEIDKGQDMAELILSIELSARKKEAPAATGECLNCGDWLEPEIRFCDADCRDDFLKRTEGAVRNFEY